MVRSAVVPAEYGSARLLVVDDEQPNLDLLAKVLDRAGYEQVTLTTDPGWALEHLPDLSREELLALAEKVRKRHILR